jgi:hypothetical protein
MQEDEGKLAPVEEGMSAQQELEEIEELARRAVACKRWRWMPGMLSNKGLRVVRRDSDGYVVGYYANQEYIAECVPGTLPELWDPATFGCLLALVRQAWGAGVYLVPDGGWIVKGARLKNGATVNLGIVAKNEAEALVAALEVAP